LVFPVLNYRDWLLRSFLCFKSCALNQCFKFFRAFCLVLGNFLVLPAENLP
jgi:hypothetical protein